jgi:hypothetical protein
VIVPRFWAEARIQRRQTQPRSQTTVRRFGWSNDSQEAAQTHAQERAEEAMKELLESKHSKHSYGFRSEPKVPYNGAEGVPIREEIVMEQGQCVITRNSYGALCLNTPDVLFADVDFASPAPTTWANLARAAGALGAIATGFALGHWGWALAGLLLALAMGQTVANAFQNLIWAFQGGPEKAALSRMKRFLLKHPDWHLRAYRTPAGLRLMALHAVFDPNEDQAHAFFQAMKSDELYVRMCQRQQCFRARLTPKPWRAGIQERMKPTSTWPVAPERLPERRAWVYDYERVCEQFSACRFIGSFGRTDAVDHRTTSVRDLHDRISKALSDLPMA